MGYHIRPAAKKLGIEKRIGWHTFHRTYSTLLKDNGEDVKVVQELLRHSSTKMTWTSTRRRKVVQMIGKKSIVPQSVPRSFRSST